MRKVLPLPVNRRNRKGVALLIVLTFLVLLTGLVVAYFARSMTALQVSNSSSNETKAALLATSATSVIIGDLRQEIIAGSTSSNGGNASWPLVYTPVSSAMMQPFRTGVPTNSTLIPNLISRSVRPGDTTGTSPALAYPTGATGYTNPPVNRTADDTANPSKVSTTTASQNGRYISRDRWNSHYLIPRKNPATTTPDSAPIDEFIPPDWVIITRKGANAVTWNSNLADSSPFNGNHAVGRYAFAIYDEGGLLDLNVAGYPGGINTLTQAQASRKTSIALANLVNISGTNELTQTQINNIIGWRNYASAQLTGSFGSTSFTSSSATNWLNNFVLNNTSGYLKVPSLTSGTPPKTDQAFLSRQQLLSLRKSLDFNQTTKAYNGTFSQNTLQYLGTFSRALEQPSYIPNPNRPKVLGTTLPPAANAAGTYVGNNRYVGNDNLVNPADGGFLGVRVKNTFTRINGTTAVVGEPLVKQKFALDRLQVLTNSATATQNNGDLIYQKFGLHRSSSSSPWTYDHGGSGRILYLSEVANLNPPREADFAELLKAAIHAGSLGKGAPSTQGGNFQYTMDVSGDLQILQIMANLIDQQKADNYPTRITFVDTAGATRNIYGIQDLPYFYRWHYLSVTTRLPIPLLTSADKSASWSVGPTKTAIVDHCRASATPPSDPGSASYLIIPQVWNPHDANTPVASGGGPTVFRVVAETNDPTGYGPWQIGAQASDGNGNFDGVSVSGTGAGSYSIAQPDPTPSDYRYLNVGNATLQFSDSTNGKAFREPTLLWRKSYPAGVSLDFSSNTTRAEVSSLTGNTYYGILVGDAPISRLADVNGVSSIIQTSTIRRANIIAGVSGDVNQNITFRMQYQDPSGNWITYQDAYVPSNLTDIPGHTLFVNAADYSGTTANKYYNPLMIGVNASGPQLTAPRGGPYDPRSNRFSTPISGKFDADDNTANGNPTLDATTKVNNGNPSTAQNLAVNSTNFVLMKTQRPTAYRGQNNNYKLPCSEYGNGAAKQMGWYSSINWQASGGNIGNSDFYDGLLSQNNTGVKVLGRDNVTSLSIYYEDADGVARRATGGYVPFSGNATGRNTNSTTTVGLPMATAGTVFTNGIATPSAQSQSRPILLHRRFRNVGEMSYAFRGIPWKNIDFFSPESGDSALLDVFCINEPPTDSMVAGKVNLNTRQAPVIQALLSGAYRDEFFGMTPAVTGALTPLATADAQKLANLLIGITSGSQPWQGPLTNVADLVGHYYPATGAVSGADVYQYTSPGNNTTYTYAGFSATLSGTAGAQDGSDLWSTNASSTRNIQRYREAPIRALAACGQTRVWNLMIDVIAQSGRYPKTATGLDQFMVEGEKRYWVHVAIDRYTGQVIDQQVEVVTE